MAQYLDKSAVIAEIEKYISNYKRVLNKVDKSSDDWVDSTLMLESKIDVLQHILSFLDTLEVKDVNPTDAFIEKACKGIEHLLSGYIIRNFHFGDSYNIDELTKDFVEYMKGE